MKAVDNNLLYVDMALEIEKRINDGTYKVGDKLPSERELSETYQVSRNVIRQAITILREKGMLVVRPGKGAYVTNIQDQLVTDTLKRVVEKYGSDIDDILEVREVLEISIIKKAVHRATENDVKILKSIYKRMESKKRYVNEFLEEDLNFHVALANATQNEIFPVLVTSFFEMTEKSPFTVTNLSNGFINVIDSAQEQHLMLIRAIEEKNESLAVATMMDHMNLFREEIRIIKEQKLI